MFDFQTQFKTNFDSTSKGKSRINSEFNLMIVDFTEKSFASIHQVNLSWICGWGTNSRRIISNLSRSSIVEGVEQGQQLEFHDHNPLIKEPNYTIFFLGFCRFSSNKGK